MSRGKTIAEKILSSKSETDAYAGDIVVARIDKAMSHDANRPLPFSIMQEMGAKSIFDSKRYFLFLDHSAPSPTESISNIHKQMRKFAADHGVKLYDIGQGICHQLMVEKGHALPGELIIGTDSHTCTYGAVNAFATGVGSTDLAMALATGCQWFKVPESIKIKLNGKLPAGVFAKDFILHLIGLIGSDGATYKALEFHGEGLTALNMEDRFTITNMGIEMGAKVCLMEADEVTGDWLSSLTKQAFNPVKADENAVYLETISCDLNVLEPQVARPHQVDNVSPINEVIGRSIDQGFIGSCTNGRLSDLHIAASILKGQKVHPRCRLIVCPASRRVLRDAVQNGLAQPLLEAGSVLGPPGCGLCAGNHMGVPGDGETVISSTNRNFRGRMGNRNAEIFLASPAVVAASVIEGKIADPRKYLRQNNADKR